MATHRSRPKAADPEVEWRVLALLKVHKTLPFSSLADACSDFPQRAVHTAVKHLRERHQVSPSFRRGDCNVVLRNEEALVAHGARASMSDDWRK